MTVLRVVLYAEGPGETLGAVSLLPEPGEPLHEEMLGPGHVLARRALMEARGLSVADIRFDSPLRMSLLRAVLARPQDRCHRAGCESLIPDVSSRQLSY